MGRSRKGILIMDANVLIDLAEADRNLIRLISDHVGKVHVPLPVLREEVDQIDEAESWFLDDDPEVILVAYGTPSRVVQSAVRAARAEGLSVGGIRPISLWPFQDSLFSRKARYLTVELNWDGQLVREVQRAAASGSSVHFWGRCGELPAVGDLLESIKRLLDGKALERDGWRTEAW